MNLPDDHSPTGGRRPRLPLALVAATAVAAVAAVVAAALVLAERRSPSSGTGAAPRPTTLTTAPFTPTTAAGGTASPTCEPGQNRPSRQDAQFTAPNGNTVAYSISFPADYWTSCKTYPVLFGLHGKQENHATFLDPVLTMRRAMDAGVLDQAVVVTPDSFSIGRWEDTDAGPAETNFITYLIPHVEQTYRVIPGASHRLLVGFSMGGHGALRFGLKYPQLFAGVWSVDGAMSREPRSYLPLVQGKPADAFHIIAVGGRTNGDRVRAAVDILKGAGVVVPYTYRDREHTMEAFVEEDEKAGWPAAKYLQQQLGRPV